MDSKSKLNINLSGVLVLLAVLVLYILKVTGTITCSWFLVFAPLLIGPGIILFYVLFGLLWVFLLALFSIK